ncbi:GNAT family N-acetyltransferase [Aquisediminimonas sediminicola]|uniref:GNAT family N-acetyltransferase n=1 Tax=Alteraquisediminimonas sediminicola TaxID=2676787 RepID=UPI001FE72929|nr:GNAT family N-acetyltransferase [Aquisediminimonas sediminicola]
MTQSTTRIPYNIQSGDAEIQLRFLADDDAEAILAFAQSIPKHDLLFLRRDIRNPKVVAAWINQHDRDMLRTIFAVSGGKIIGCAALARDELSWSMHVGDIRILISPDARGSGLGRILLKELLALAADMSLTKVTASMTPDQVAGIAMFEDEGFVPEALLRDHVRDPSSGNLSDLVVFSLNLERAASQRTVFGSPEA